MSGRGIVNPLWGCAHNEERSPYSTGRQTCTGKLRYRPCPFGKRWICDKHQDEADQVADENAFWDGHSAAAEAEHRGRFDG